MDNIDEIVELTNEPGQVYAVHLSKPHLDGYQLGDNAGFVLKSALFGHNGVEVYEATSGTDRYPPGRISKVSLSFEEIERFIAAHQKHQAARKAAEEDHQKRLKVAILTDDYDPFIDTDDLP
jgi:hypothetical protein